MMLSMRFFKRYEAPDKGFSFFPTIKIQLFITLDMADRTMIDHLVEGTFNGSVYYKPDDER